MSALTHRMAFRHLATGKEHLDGAAIGDKASVQRVCDDFNRWYGATTFHWPEAVPKPCSRCKGRGTVSEDPAPDCPSVAYPAEECGACGGSGEVQP